MANQPPRPPFDPGYQNASGFPNPSKTLSIPAMRESIQAIGVNASSIASTHPQYTQTEISCTGFDESDPAVQLALWQMPSSTSALKSYPNGRPVLYYIHSGGQIAGDRFFGPQFAMSHFSPADNILFASPEYRLAPEHPAPAAVKDVYAGLVYLFTHAKDLNIDPAKIVLYGVSGGGSLAASAALWSRKVGGPRCCALVLNIPMLDDRGGEYVSTKQFWDGTVWPGWTDEQAWNAILGDGEKSDADGFKVAARAESLAGLPPVFIDIGECESMRDQAVAFASRIWKDGGSAELHVWPGVYHGAAMFESSVPVSLEMVRLQRAFVRKVLGLNGQDENAEGLRAANL